jgi:hypothetical protein
MITGLRQPSLAAAARLFNFDANLARPGPILFPPLLFTTSTLGPVGITEGSGFIAFRIGNVPKWVIDVRRFAGNPVLAVERPSGATGLRATLTGARLPGTNVAADLTLNLALVPHIGGARIRTTLKLVYGGFAFTGDFVAWLNGAIQATSPVELPGPVCGLGAAGTVTATGDATATFFPNWTLLAIGADLATVVGVGDPLPAGMIAFVLLEPQAHSLFVNPPPLRTSVLLTAAGPWKNLLPVAATPIGTLTEVGDNFDVMALEVGEDAKGTRRQAFLTGSVAGGDALQFKLTVGSGPSDPDGGPLTLGLRHALLMKVFDPPAPTGALFAAFMPVPVWGRAGGIGFAVAGIAFEGEFVLVTTGDSVASVYCQPGLVGVAPPVASAVSEPAPISPGARLAFVAANLPSASPPPANWVSVGTLAQGALRATFSDYAFMLLRPSDLLWLGYRFTNVVLQGDDSAAPRLVPTANASSTPALAVSLAPQNIAERAYFEHVEGQKIPQNVVTSPPQDDVDNQGGHETPPETPDEPPVASRAAAESRLAFTLPAGVQSLPLTSDALLSWDSFDQRVVPAALPAGTLPPNDPVPLRAPQPDETAIELPYRLILSPSAVGRWKHATAAVEHEGHTELWHARLEGGDAQRAVRAVWSYDVPLRPQDHQHVPFRMSLDMRDRYEIVELSANFNLVRPDQQPYKPEAIAVERMMLSSLGGWVRSRGAWDPPSRAYPRQFASRAVISVLDLARSPVRAPTAIAGLGAFFPALAERFSVEEWRHIASMGRDQYVRVVYRGHLFPCGHRASLVKVTERKFAPAPFSGRMMAYLRQRMFIVLRQHVRDYGALRGALNNGGRELPFNSIEITTLTTPDLDDPVSHQIGTHGQDAFWPYVNGQPFLFHLIATDQVGQRSEFSAPQIFISQSATGDPVAEALTDYSSRPDLRRHDFAGQKVAFAAIKTPGDTTFEADKILFAADRFVPPSEDEAPYNPKIEAADVHLPAVRQLSSPGNADAPVTIKYYADFVSHDFKAGDVFAELANPPDMRFGGDKSLGVGAPNLSIVGLSRRFGPVGGDPADIGGTLGNFAGGTVDPKQFFDTSAKILGAITLHDLIALLHPNQITDDKVLRVKTDTGDPAVVKTFLDWTPDVHDLPVLAFNRNDATIVPLKLHAEVTVPLGHPEQKSSTIVGTLNEFQINLAEVIKLNFHRLVFTAVSGHKLDVNATLYRQDETFPHAPASGGVVFDGPLVFINELRKVIPSDGFSDPPSLEVTPEGVTAGYTLKLPSVGVGIFSLENISLGAALTIPFTGDPVRARFHFSEREHPFLLSVAIFGGGGFFALGVGADGVELVEASLEFGGHVAIDLGVASGGVYIMAGIYFKGEQKIAPTTHVAVTLTGYLRAGGELEVLGIISISMEFYLGLTYESDGNKVWGEARVTVEVHVLMFSTGVTVTCRREFADPPFSIQQMLPTKQTWIDYAEAFA